MTSRLVHWAAAIAVLIVLCSAAIVWGAARSTRAGTSTPAAAVSQTAGSSASASTTDPGARTSGTAANTRPHVVEPTAGVSPNPSAAVTSIETGDIPAPTTISPSSAVPVSDAVIRQELLASGVTANPDQAQLTPNLLAVAPIGAPLAVQQVIAAGNAIAKLPYVWGGGHGTYADTGYDCSGSISYVFAAAHLINSTMVSGELASWGAPGPGKWITIFVNGGHTFMYVAGLRFDTVALAETGSRWSARSADEPDLSTFSIRHPPGL